MKDKIEAILFAAGRYIEAEYIAKLLQTDLRSVKKALSELKEDYEKREGCAIHVAQENDQWKLQVKDSYLEYASKLAGDTEITKTVLETLAVVAWKNGISQAELIKIRGPAAYEHIGELVDRGFLTKVAEGRSFKLTLQQKFFDYFDVEGRENIKELFAQVEADKASAQAEIDAKQAEYDARVRAAQEAVKTPSAAVSPLAATSAPSAQVAAPPAPVPPPKDLITEAKEAAEKIMPTPGQHEFGTIEAQADLEAAEKAVKEFGNEVQELKEEVEESAKEAASPAPEHHKAAHHPAKHPHKAHPEHSHEHKKTH